MSDSLKDLVQPAMKILLYGGIIFIIVRFVWDFHTIAGYFRKDKKDKP